jgi:hypothetical protein
LRSRCPTTAARCSTTASSCGATTGSKHIAAKIPWLLASKGGGYFATGQCADGAGKQLNGVMTDICRAFGVDSPFGATWPGLAM